MPPEEALSMPRPKLDDPRYYLNRHESWLAFNRRVLEEAFDEGNPLLERVKFLAITASNLDEFVEVRVAGLLQEVEQGNQLTGPDGLSPAEQLQRLAQELHRFVEAQYDCWNQQLLPALRREGIRILSVATLNRAGHDAMDLFFTRRVDPILTPVTIDPSHPFPHVLNKALCVAFHLRHHSKSGATYLGVVTVPRKLPRLVRVPNKSGSFDYIFLHDLIESHTRNLYKGYKIISSGAFRATRNSNLYLHEEESRSLLDLIDSQLHNRRKGDVVRLEIEASAPAEIVNPLTQQFGLQPWQIFRTRGPVNLSRLFYLADQTARPDLKFPPFVSKSLTFGPKTSGLLDAIRERDILLHHPYESYEPVVSFIEGAAHDPQVLSVKQTLYRTNENSPIVRALMEAAQNKEVTVVVELKARFDEASNIRWARSLEDAGVQVFYGLVGLKTHCKLALLARQDADGEIRQYAHLGTGNYNPSTAHFYADLSLFTCDPELTGAVHAVFNFLTARSEQTNYKPLFVSPVDLAKNCIELIDREANHARRGRPARIIAKVNALLDQPMIEALYRASRAGVDVDLVVRGACSLRPGVRGISDRIRVRSIVGRFLEHSRIFYFANGGESDIYLGSADWMPRNLYERVEVMFPVKDGALRHRIVGEILENYLEDKHKSRILRSDGSYVRAYRADGSRNGRRFSAQDSFIGLAEAKPETKTAPGLRFLADGLNGKPTPRVEL
jgi:polyphosphate kinase